MRHALVALCLLAGTAAARPPPPPPEEPEPPRIEWSTWFRLGFGYEAQPIAETTPRMIGAPTHEPGTGWEVGLGFEASVGLGAPHRRFGLWGELRGTELFAGGEIVLQRLPRELDLFFYKGQGVAMLRGGGNPDRGTVSLAYGYLAPWKLFGPWRGATRYMIGVRFVGTYTRAWNDPRDWSATFGLECEPVGALRYLLGIKALY